MMKYATSLALTAMLAADSGRIVNVESIHGLVGLTKVTAMKNTTSGVICPTGYGHRWYKNRSMP